LLGQSVFANYYNFQNLGQHALLVNLESEAFQAGETNDIFSDSNSELVPLNFAHVLVLLRAEVLESDPKSVHLAHVGKDEFYGIIDVSIIRSFIL